jgi:high-affinity iron transporter
LPAGQERQDQHLGVAAAVWTVSAGDSSPVGPPVVRLDELIALSGGRLLVGLNPQVHPGPFTAKWSISQTTTVWVASGALLDAQRQGAAVVTIKGSGLQEPRTLSVADPAAASTWQVSTGYRDAVAAAVARFGAAQAERAFWAVDVPLVLAIGAVAVGVAAGCRLRTLRMTAEPGSPAFPPDPQPAKADLP